VTVLLEGRLYAAGGEEGMVVDPQHEESFCIGEGDVSGIILGVELALRVMYVGQRSILRMHPKFGFLPDERPEGVGERDRFEYKVALLSVGARPKNPAEMTSSERVAMVDENNEKGNSEYKAGNLTRAVRFYKKGLEFVKYVLPPKEEDENEGAVLSEEGKAEKKSLVAAKVRSGTNLCVAMAALDKHTSAEDMCDMVLKVDPANVKALYQKGKAVCRRKDYEEARVFLAQADEASPNNPAILRELQTVDLVLREKENQRRSMYNRMMGAPKAQADVRVIKPVQQASTVEIEEITEEEDDLDTPNKDAKPEPGSLPPAGSDKSNAEKAPAPAPYGKFPMPNPGRRKGRSNADLTVLLCTIASMLLLIWWAIRPRELAASEQEL